jgi:hypothetical protein
MTIYTLFIACMSGSLEIDKTTEGGDRLNNYLLLTTIVTSAYRDLGTFRGA